MVQVIVVELTTVGEAQVEPPKSTVAPVKNPVPVIVAVVPPARAPAVGRTAVTVGGGI